MVIACGEKNARAFPLMYCFFFIWKVPKRKMTSRRSFWMHKFFSFQNFHGVSQVIPQLTNATICQQRCYIVHLVLCKDKALFFFVVCFPSGNLWSCSILQHCRGYWVCNPMMRYVILECVIRSLFLSQCNAQSEKNDGGGKVSCCKCVGVPRGCFGNNVRSRRNIFWIHDWPLVSLWSPQRSPLICPSGSHMLLKWLRLQICVYLLLIPHLERRRMLET